MSAHRRPTGAALCALLTIYSAVGLVGAVALPAPAHAQDEPHSGCANPDTSCLQKLREAQEKIDEHKGSGVSEAKERAKAAGDAVKECVKCAWEEVKSGIDRVKPEDKSDHPK